MKESEALRLAGLLAVTGHGWTDAHVEVYAAEFASEMTDVQAAEAAVRQIIRTWDKPVRVPIGSVLQQYRVEMDRRAMSGPRAISTGPVVPLSEGIQIAWRAYVAEAHRTGRKPNRELFGKWSALLRDSLPND